MDKIEYGQREWNQNAEAANAEARRRAEYTRDQPDAESRKAVWFCDLGALTSLPQELAEIEGLKQLFVGDGNTPEGKMHAPSQKITDWSVLVKLTTLAELSAIDSGLEKLDLLSGRSGLSSLSFDHTPVSDLGPLSGLSGLSSLSFDGTQVSDLGPLSGLSVLSSLSFDGTHVSDLSPLLSLPVFASLDGTYLRFHNTPLARSDRRWQMLSGLPPKTAATDAVLYLKGEHPDFREPLDGAQQPTGQAAMASGGPVELVEQDGRAEVADVQQFQPPIALDTPVVAKSLSELRALVDILTDDLTAANNVDPLLRSRVGRYGDALQAQGTPTLTVLDANMLLIRGMVADDYICAPLDKGTLGGLHHVIECHDRLGATPTVPEVLPILPEVPDQPDDMRSAIEAIKAVGAVVNEGVSQGVVGNTVVVAINSTVDVANTAFSTVPAHTADEVAQRRGLGSWALRMAGGLAWSLDVYARTHSWSLTPAGAALMQRMAELIKQLLPFFGG